jgi:hypothetical protein
MKASKFSLVIALVAGVLLAGSSAVRAQDGEKKKDGPSDTPKRERPGAPGGAGGGDRAGMMKERFDKMATELKLNEEQKKKVQAAFQKRMESMRGLQDATPEDRREKAKAAQEAMNKEMKTILTAEQYAQFEKMPALGRPGGPGGEGKGEGKKRKDGEKKKE